MMILLFIMKNGVVFPIAIPPQVEAYDYFCQYERLDVVGDFFKGKHAQSGDFMKIRVSEILAVQLSEEGSLQRKVLVPQGGRIQ